MIKKGYTLIEMFFVMMLSSLLLFLILCQIQNIRKLSITPSDYTDIIIASKQISQELMESKIIELDDEQITYTNLINTFTLHQVGNNLIKEPGYVVFLLDVDDLIFEIEDDLIIMNVIRNDQDYQQIIGVNVNES